MLNNNQSKLINTYKSIALMGEVLKRAIISMHIAGVEIVLDVDQTVYDKGQWDVEFLTWMVDSNIPVVFATHGATLDKGTCPVAHSVISVDTTVAVGTDGMPMLNDQDMPICLKLVPDNCVLIDNMAQYYGDDASVLDKQYII